ncbi:glycine cleavage system aminomethyltransferase GcvT [Methylobacterium sp. P31]
MVPFAGYAMPVQYPAGLIKEHLHTRAAAGLFDVSHMGQIALRADDPAEAARALEALMPTDVVGLAPGRQRYGLLTDEAGGILDDLMVANFGDRLVLVVNAANKWTDAAHLRASLPAAVSVETLDRGLLALQGPAAGAVLTALAPEVAEMRFMDAREIEVAGMPCLVTRSGYTGEDGFEISTPLAATEAVAEALLADTAVLPVGLGARDSLRLEAGLCLYGADIDTATSPVEAGLTFAISPARRGGGFPGAARILAEIQKGPARRRIGLLPEGRAPVRAGALLFAGADDDVPAGRVTSGGFGPSLGAPAAMGYLPAALAGSGTRVFAEVRGQRLPATVTSLPFVAAGFKRD